MTSITQKLKKIRDTLLSVTAYVYHYEAEYKKNFYIVWQETGEAESLAQDNKKCEQVLQGTIDYYTKDDYDVLIDEIQQALNESEISFHLNSVQYEEETSYIHYEWIWEI
ncbi:MULTISPECIES: hypothetical protein [Bacillota]|jgi:hypothetical protein|uniref:hypothetical protein n=1 Tax=Bacillota TaxID=1239 RepID=UPI000E40C165|nr:MULTISPECIES: hypothetical protein [Bacillota]RGB58592.1 hypothetical protein DW271_02585 [Absiella sp. AM22-9]DAY77832.1 MAG TPA: hypothetical protein [Caudoviricetes sp.]